MRDDAKSELKFFRGVGNLNGSGAVATEPISELQML